MILLPAIVKNYNNDTVSGICSKCGSRLNASYSGYNSQSPWNSFTRYRAHEENECKDYATQLAKELSIKKLQTLISLRERWDNENSLNEIEYATVLPLFRTKAKLELLKENVPAELLQEKIVFDTLVNKIDGFMDRKNRKERPTEEDIEYKLFLECFTWQNTLAERELSPKKNLVILRLLTDEEIKELIEQKEGLLLTC